MKKLSSDKYENIRILFANDYPNLPMIHGIIEQSLPGDVWVDNESDPTVCLITTGAPYCFMTGHCSKEVFTKCFELLKPKQFVKVVIKPEPLFDIAKFGFTPVQRRQYRYKNIQNNMPIYQNDTNYQLKKIEDLDTINSCIWKSLMESMYGTVEKFLENGIGFILWDDKNKIIASEAYGIASKKYVEIGTVTHEDYRGQKLSTILCNHLMRHLVQENLHPVWSCDYANTASWKVAEKQGMDELINYTVYVYNSIQQK